MSPSSQVFGEEAILFEIERAWADVGDVHRIDDPMLMRSVGGIWLKRLKSGCTNAQKRYSFKKGKK